MTDQTPVDEAEIKKVVDAAIKKMYEAGQNEIMFMVLPLSLYRVLGLPLHESNNAVYEYQGTNRQGAPHHQKIAIDYSKANHIRVNGESKCVLTNVKKLVEKLGGNG